VIAKTRTDATFQFYERFKALTVGYTRWLYLGVCCWWWTKNEWM